MPKFIVTKSVDAYANYSALVDGDDAADAIANAKEREHELTWHPVCVNEYDDTEWGNFEPEEVADDYQMGEPAERWPADLPKPNLKHAANCIAWASQQGYALAEIAAIDLGKAMGQQPAWKDNGTYADFIIFLPTITDAERVVKLDWQGNVVEGR